MAAVWVLLAFTAIAVAILVAKDRLLAPPPPPKGPSRLDFLRKADFPVRCSWCRISFLARKATLLEKRELGWEVLDPARAVGAMDEGQQTRALEGILNADLPNVRRLCSEKCTRAFLGSMGASEEAIAKRFVRCAYCSLPFLLGSTRCPGCGAPTGEARAG